MEQATSYDSKTLDPVRQRLLELLPLSRSSLRRASLALGRDPAYLHQFVHRGTPRVLAKHDREALAAHLGCPPEELEHDRMLSRRPRGEARRRRAPRGYRSIPEIDVRAAAGSAAWHEVLEEAKETWLLADPLIRHEFRARPEDLRMITVDGDSMEPLLSSGDRLLIDLSRRVPVPPGIFVIWDGMGLVAKRIEHVPLSEPPRVRIKSVNPDYPGYERLAEEIRVVGRAVWVSRRL